MPEVLPKTAFGVDARSQFQGLSRLLPCTGFLGTGHSVIYFLHGT